MNPFAQQIVVDTVTKSNSRKQRYSAARTRYRARVMRTSNIQSILFLAAGIFSAGFGLKSFLLPNHFIDGGATGISLLLSRVLHLPLPPLIVLINIPFILLGFRQIGKTFAIRTVLAILGLAVCLAIVDYPM